MPKENRKINHGVRIGVKVYTEGMEDELASVLSKNDIQRLTDKGSLEGFAEKSETPVENTAPRISRAELRKPKGKDK